jgi:RNA polymerase sigma-70 factor, ECF subfamily
MVDKIWTELHEDLHRFICSRVGHQEHCHDILHDVFLKIASGTKALNEVDNIKSYLIRIAANTITDHYRKVRSFEPNFEVANDQTEEFRDHTTVLSNQFLHKTIASLPEPYREALIKTELEGLTQKDYAEFANISLSGAKSRVQRARQKLKEQILACCDYNFDKYGNIISCCGEEISGSCCR